LARAAASTATTTATTTTAATTSTRSSTRSALPTGPTRTIKSIRAILPFGSIRPIGPNVATTSTALAAAHLAQCPKNALNLCRNLPRCQLIVIKRCDQLLEPPLSSLEPLSQALKIRADLLRARRLTHAPLLSVRPAALARPPAPLRPAFTITITGATTNTGPGWRRSTRPRL